MDLEQVHIEKNNLALLEEKNVVILHIHGGGFVAMSSSSHQNYTRIWANELNIPVFSIDYRLSPESRFPDALNDCWQVYYWLLEEGEIHLDMKIDNIIIAGDSAGGNLCSALVLLCLKKKYKLPLACILSYPASFVGENKFVPSLLFSLDDILLPTKFLKSALSAYAGEIINENPECQADTFDLLSPLCADEELLR